MVRRGWQKAGILPIARGQSEDYIDARGVEQESLLMRDLEATMGELRTQMEATGISKSEQNEIPSSASDIVSIEAAVEEDEQCPPSIEAMVHDDAIMGRRCRSWWNSARPGSDGCTG